MQLSCQDALDGQETSSLTAVLAGAAWELTFNFRVREKNRVENVQEGKEVRRPRSIQGFM